MQNSTGSDFNSERGPHVADLSYLLSISSSLSAYIDNFGISDKGINESYFYSISKQLCTWIVNFHFCDFQNVELRPCVPKSWSGEEK